jgi:two-component system, LytTR family, sensor kinase
MLKINLRYWGCQLLGWGGWSLLNLFLISLFVGEVDVKPEKERIYYNTLVIESLCFIISTHLLRLVLRRINWIHLPSRKVVMLFITSITLTGLLAYYGSKITAQAFDTSLTEYEKKERFDKAVDIEKRLGLVGTTYYLTKPDPVKDSAQYNKIQSIKKTGWTRNKQGVWQYENKRKGSFWWDLIFSFILIALWLLIYFVWHYVEKEQKDEVDKLTLEKTVKELELKTIKSHINPHFIFNSLNSIRALVDENPSRARKAVTELANILRSSMQVEKLETVPLQQELAIVKDYLALEQMRFEERLKIELEIDDNTLNLPVPPMMLQTLTENAIKHGISKDINGGYIKIISRIRNGAHELIIQNSGELNGEVNGNGFGIKSTEDRLKHLYQGKARFKITTQEGIVESEIIMPISTI